MLDSVTRAVTAEDNWNKIQFVRYFPHEEWERVHPNANKFEVLGAREYLYSDNTTKNQEEPKNQEQPEPERYWDRIHEITQEKADQNKGGYELAIRKFEPKDLWIMNFIILGLDDVLPNICWLYCHKLVNAIIRATADHRMQDPETVLQWAYDSRIIYQTSARPILESDGKPSTMAYRRQRILPGMKAPEVAWEPYKDPPYINVDEHLRNLTPSEAARARDCANYPVSEVKDAIALRHFMGRYSLVIMLSRCQPWREIIGDLLDTNNLPTGIICHNVHYQTASFNSHMHSSYPDVRSARLRGIIHKHYQAFPFESQAWDVFGFVGDKYRLPTNLKIYLRRTEIPPVLRNPLDPPPEEYQHRHAM
jgi:hypothetical protein